MRIHCLLLLIAFVDLPAELRCASSQPIAIPTHLTNVHPRVAARQGNSQAEISALVAEDAEARKTVEKTRVELSPYLDHVRQDPMWVASRLQMYWTSHATDVYNRGDVFDHASGRAPAATVRYPGSRNPVSVYRAPKLEDIPPYEDDTRGVWLINTSAPGEPLEWASPSKSGRVIDGINTSILRMAQNAAELAWITGDEEYARFAFTIFDTYMRGMYYRNEPIDLNHGHSQTIYGMSTFEVIQEGSVLPSLASTYDFLHDYIERHHPGALPIYADAFRKWINLTIHNGVPFNNWDLFEANIIASVAFVLEDDSAYADGHGSHYYLNLILNEDSIRQWSLRKLAARGFDSETGIWFEAPGYSMTVVADFISLINRMDRSAGTDLLQDIPVVRKAVTAMAQYAFQNGTTVSWGDSHYGPISAIPARSMVENARLHHRHEDEVYFTGLAKFFDQLNSEGRQRRPSEAEPRSRGFGLESLFDREHVELDPSIPPLKPEQVLTATFSAPSVSYFVQRNGLDPQNGLTISEAGSLGNHQHANGITIELYGMGLPLAPDSGIGTNYFEADHNEYYAQFPAHNTVVVDGVSSYPTMLSHHGFTVNASFPTPGDKQGFALPMTYADVSFLEPETNSDQRRVTATIRTSPEHAYSIDIFRSHRRDGKDREHDYFFHALGQSLEITAGDSSALAQAPTDKLTFAEETLGAYDYLWDKHTLAPAAIYHAIYKLDLPQQPQVQLHAWMAGAANRQMFSVLAPAARSLGDLVPKEIGALPLHTIVLRQSGEAWTHPFVSVFEPARTDQDSSIQSVQQISMSSAPAGAVAVQVKEDKSRQQTILSAVKREDVIRTRDAACQATYCVWDSGPGLTRMLLGDGNWASTPRLHLKMIGGAGSAFVERQGTHLSISLSRSAEIVLPVEGEAKTLRIGERRIAGERVHIGTREWVRFLLDPTALVDAELTQQ